MKIFYDVDTQNDFMNADGALYVPGAEKIKQNLEKITKYALSKGIKIIASMDAHDYNSAEMQENGGPFPYHCMKNEEGQKKIQETKLETAIIIPNEKIEGIDKKVYDATAIIIEKDHYDVSTNPNFEKVIKATEADTAIVYGVATDYCVKAAALALKKLGLETIVITDAIAAVSAETEKEALEEMTKEGINYMTLTEACYEI